MARDRISGGKASNDRTAEDSDLRIEKYRLDAGGMNDLSWRFDEKSLDEDMAKEAKERSAELNSEIAVEKVVSF